MPKLHDMTLVDEDFAKTGPNQRTLTQPIAASSDAVFGWLADGPAWKDWLGITVEWTTPEPRGVGTTRTVRTRGQRIDETFLVWDHGRRMNFRFDRSTLPASAFCEDYDVRPTGNGSCELVWSYAFHWTGPLPAVTSRLFGVVFGAQTSRAIKKFAKLVESDPNRFLD